MEKIKETLKKLPQAAGVYLFKNESAVVLYVGKAINLARRVKSYFVVDPKISIKTKALVDHIRSIEIIQTSSEFDALLLEASLIKKYSPRYNIAAKDDKSPLYLHIGMKNILPQIRMVRRSDIDPHMQEIIGPFTSTHAARDLLSSLRKVIPFCLQKQRNGKPCFYTHLGLCDPCPCVIEKLPQGREKQVLTEKYRRNIFRLLRILSGSSTEVLHDLEKEMWLSAKEERFEDAAKQKKRVDSLYALLTKHYDPFIYETAQFPAKAKEDANELHEALIPFFPLLKKLHRIECIDISNTAGQFATGSLVVLLDGLPVSSEYRRFRIRSKDSPNDVAMIAEVVARRIRHTEWAPPDLLVLDGGKGQLHAATQVLSGAGLSWPTIGLAKRNEEVIVQISGGYKTLRLPFTSGAIQVVQRTRDEAHRFAKRYHVYLRNSLRKPGKAV